jgi:hypothetical protein
MKHRISSYLKIWGFLSFLLSVFFILAFFTEAEKTGNIVIYNFEFLVISIAIFFISFIQFTSSEIEYDSVNLYRTTFKKQEIIPLKNIRVVKLTMTSINHMNLWKVKYLNNFGKEVYFRFLPRLFYKNFEDFKTAVLKVNPNCQFINWSDSWDFDQ